MNTRTWHMARLSNNWLALSCLLACVAALWSTRKYYAVCTLLLCAGPIEGCSAVPAVLTYYGFRSLVCASWCSEEEKKQVQKLKLCCFVFLGGHIASRVDDTASFVHKRSTSPAVTFTSRLVPPSTMTWTEKSACVANMPHLHKHTRTCHTYCLLFYGVVVVSRMVPVSYTHLTLPTIYSV